MTELFSGSIDTESENKPELPKPAAQARFEFASLPRQQFLAVSARKQTTVGSKVEHHAQTATLVSKTSEPV